MRFRSCLPKIATALAFAVVPIIALACGDPARDFVAGIEAAMVTVPAGSFVMGSEAGAPDASPPHEVTLSRPFAVLRHEVTFDEYDAYCELSGVPKPGDDGRGRGTMPVINVSYAAAARFCNFLSEAAGLRPCYNSTGFEFDAEADGYRLQTEAEWEYAARGGPAGTAGTGPASGGQAYSGSAVADEVAWYGDLAAPRPVEGKAPNALGLYDMSGNVWEWCNDWYGDDYYARSPAVDPLGAAYKDVSGGYGAKRVRRGGNYHESAEHAAVWARSCDRPTQADAGMGFRIARTAGG
ncbi:MAG: formylglycine-generating enzyme family protein [Spirochaetes bacterium]|nr:formylglycine-generating enzyme family protein [Spirochaetota bacterium]MBU1079348.1 formylglycine-generating enzyme family protein [Spirochaetota bacterium]